MVMVQLPGVVVETERQVQMVVVQEEESPLVVLVILFSILVIPQTSKVVIDSL